MYIEEYYGQLYQMLSSGPNECQCQSHLCLNVERFHQLYQLKLVLLSDFCEIQIGNHKPINQSINQKRIKVTKVTNVTARPLRML